jgi:hypothetical protein
LKRNLTIKDSERPLRQPYGGCERSGCLAKRSRAEEVVNEGHELPRPPERGVQGDLVQVFDDDIVVVPGEILPIITVRNKRVAVTSADPVNVDPILNFALRSGRPGAAQQVDRVAARNYPTENLLKMKLCTAGLGIPAILPVEDEYPH